MSQNASKSPRKPSKKKATKPRVSANRNTIDFPETRGKVPIFQRSMESVGKDKNPRVGRIYRRKHDKRAQRYGFPTFGDMQKWWARVSHIAKQTIFRGAKRGG